MSCVWFLLLMALAVGSCRGQKLELFMEEYIWKTLDFAWPYDNQRVDALSKENYLPENNALAGIRVWRDRIYLTVPRWKPGVPATLVSISSTKHERPSPPLEPFPNWDMQIIGNCTALQSVQNIEIDKNGGMWVLDSGRVNTMSNNPELRCRPKLLLIDVKDTMSPKILQPFPLPDSVLSRANDSVLVDLVLDNDVIYISDASPTDPGIIVVNTQSNQMWKVNDATMQGNSNWQTTVSGKRLNFQSGINALALTPVSSVSNGVPNRTLFYAPLSSDNLYGVSTAALRDQNMHYNIRSYITDFGNKTSFSQGMTVDSHGIMYLGLNSMDAIARWDTRRLPLQDNLKVLTKDTVRMQWPSSLSIDDSGSLWVISNRLQNFMTGNVDLDATNYRVMRAIVNTRSYQYPAETPSEETSTRPGYVDYTTERQDFTKNMSYTQRPGDMMDHNNHHNNTGNAAESVARPTSVVLTILTSLVTFILALA